jgi:hypothetical protein
VWIDWILSFFAIDANNITDMQVDIHLPKENGLKSLNLMVSHTSSHDYSFFLTSVTIDHHMLLAPKR